MAMLQSLNPANGDVVGEVPITPVDQIGAVVARARAAQPAWAALSAEERGALLRPAGEAMLRRADELGKLLTREMGKPLAEATGEVTHCAQVIASGEKARDIAKALEPQVLEDENVTSTIYRDPFGVAACISPWNFPMAMPHSQVIPALVAGNTVVLKPSEETPLIADAYAQALIEALPDDVLQVVHGAGDQGRALVASDVDLIVFTGSRETGKHILAEASKGLKRVILELGGKDPMIVLDGADLDAAAAFAARNSFRNAGQVCVATERIFVEDAIHDEFVGALIEKTREMRLGNGMDEGTAVGPMVSQRQKSIVTSQLDDAVKCGATVAHGGEPAEGNFCSPTVLTNVTPDMRIARDETFGPVACVYRVSDAEQAVQMANDTPFGLGACVYGPEDKASQVARRLTAGMIGVNRSLGGASGTPWVGARESGYGFHGGPEGHRQFTQTRVVSKGI